jgi:hypothetical protein
LTNAEVRLIMNLKNLAPERFRDKLFSVRGTRCAGRFMES